VVQILHKAQRPGDKILWPGEGLRAPGFRLSKEPGLSADAPAFASALFVLIFMEAGIVFFKTFNFY
jgi:hypothetical protein